MKRLLSVLLVLVLVAAMALPVSATSVKYADPKIGSIDKGAFGDYTGNAAINPEQTRPGDEIIIPILGDGFWDESDVNMGDMWDPVNGYGPSVAQLKANNVVARLHVVKGKKYIRDAKIVKYTPTPRNPARAAMRIRFVKEIDSSAEITYEFSAYLSLNHSWTPATEQFGGMVRNELYDVTNLTYLFIGDGSIAECYGTSMNLELALDNGVSIYRDMYRGDRFYGRAKLRDTNDKNDAILLAYKEIERVYDITTINVKFNGTPVSLTNELKDPVQYYVYNLAGEFVGMSHDMLPFSARYYITNKPIEIDPSLDQSPDLTPDDIKMGAALTQFVDGVREENTVTLP